GRRHGRGRRGFRRLGLLSGRRGLRGFLLPRGLLGLALFGRRALAVLQRRGVFAVGEDHRDRRVYGYVGSAFRHQNLAERAFVDRLHFHGGFVSFDFSDHIARFDPISFFF